MIIRLFNSLLRLLANHHLKFSIYFVISAIGLTLSVTVFHACHAYFHIRPFYANVIADILATILVFTCSWYFIFDHQKNHFNAKFVLNIIIKLLVIYAMSLVIVLCQNIIMFYFPGEENNQIREYLLTSSKVLVSPISLMINYITTFFLLEKISLKKSR